MKFHKYYAIHGFRGQKWSPSQPGPKCLLYTSGFTGIRMPLWEKSWETAEIHEFHIISWSSTKMMKFMCFVAKSCTLRSRGRKTYYIQADLQVSACHFRINHAFPPQNCVIFTFYDFMVISWKSVDFMKIHEMMENQRNELPRTCKIVQ